MLGIQNNEALGLSGGPIEKTIRDILDGLNIPEGSYEPILAGLMRAVREATSTRDFAQLLGYLLVPAEKPVQLKVKAHIRTVLSRHGAEATGNAIASQIDKPFLYERLNANGEKLSPSHESSIHHH